jgi:hypothetical protein
LIQVVALDGDEVTPVCLHDPERDVQAPCLFDRLIARNDNAVPID